MTKGSNVIELDRVRSILSEVSSLIDELDGLELDETMAVDTPTSRPSNKERARQSQKLNLLSDRLTLAASLVRVEYWHARGHSDPLNPSRPTFRELTPGDVPAQGTDGLSPAPQ